MTSKALSQKFDVTFGKDGAVPVPVGRRFAFGDTRIEERFEEDIEENHIFVLRVETHRGRWEKRVSRGIRYSLQDHKVPPLFYFSSSSLLEENQEGDPKFEPLGGSPSFSSEDYEILREFPWYDLSLSGVRPFASAPVRSKPRRTYDPSRPTRDPEGDYVPMYLADVLYSAGGESGLNSRDAYLRNLARPPACLMKSPLKRLGHRDSEPFQIQVRKLWKQTKGSFTQSHRRRLRSQPGSLVDNRVVAAGRAASVPLAATGSTPSPQRAGCARWSVLSNRKQGASNYRRDTQ